MSKDKLHIKDLSLLEIEEFVLSKNEKKFRAKQNSLPLTLQSAKKAGK